MTYRVLFVTQYARFRFPFSQNMWKYCFPDSFSDPIKSHVCYSRSFCFAVPLTIIFSAIFFVATVLVVVGCLYLLGPFSWMLLSGSFQTILLIILRWLMPLHYTLCCILYALVHSFDFVHRKYILWL